MCDRGVASRAFLVTAALVVAASACSTGQDPNSTAVRAVARGSVETEAGQPVPDAIVHITTRIDQPSGSVGLTDDSVRTDGDGHFSVVMFATGAPPSEGSVRVEVSPPTGSNLKPTVVQGRTVRFDFPLPPVDTVDLDITLAAQSEAAQ